ncbi:hypothetical protein CHS0354_008627 [Potamilus streckersoni]|uniref:Uncharacterized protein n=1 Tax=Potamilus streckersoni TaxID=2493646 RepID=A0AAE0TI18_9BIVA|nr:hypothetical protein CHS0354_008627 [Potamilus streckersoni]
MYIYREGAKDYKLMEEKHLNHNQAKHGHDNRNINPPRTTTATTTTATTNHSEPQTTKPAQTTPTQTRLNDNGMKPQSRQTPSKDQPHYIHHQEEPTTSLKLNQSTKSPDNTTTIKSGHKTTKRNEHYHEFSENSIEHQGIFITLETKQITIYNIYDTVHKNSSTIQDYEQITKDKTTNSIICGDK